MTTKEMQEAILKWKKEQDCCILAHCYQTHDILEVADFVGDSFGLAQKAAKTKCKRVMMCGVRFMAETVKILSPEKQVYLPKAEAGCPMAEQLDVEMLQQMKEIYPEHCVVAYINTTAALKTLCDVCVTSSSAVDIIRKIPNKKILFIPDCNLGDYVAKQRCIGQGVGRKTNSGKGISADAWRLPDPRSDYCQGRRKGTGCTSRCRAAGTSGMPAGSHRTGGLCWQHNRHYELCSKE